MTDRQHLAFQLLILPIVLVPAVVYGGTLGLVLAFVGGFTIGAAVALVVARDL